MKEMQKDRVRAIQLLNEWEDEGISDEKLKELYSLVKYDLIFSKNLKEEIELVLSIRETNKKMEDLKKI